MGLLNVNDKNFKEEVLKANLPVLVDFWAPWCGPCKMVAPLIEELGQEYQAKLKIVKFNVDEGQGVPTQYGIMSIPTLIFFKGGKIINQITGALSKSQLKKRIEETI